MRAGIQLVAREGDGVMAKGDEVTVRANTYIASILAVSEAGLRSARRDALQAHLVVQGVQTDGSLSNPAASGGDVSRRRVGR